MWQRIIWQCGRGKIKNSKPYNMKQLQLLLICLLLTACNKEKSLIGKIESETNWKFESHEAKNADEWNSYTCTKPSKDDCYQKTERVKEIIDKDFGSAGLVTSKALLHEPSSADEWKWESAERDITYRRYLRNHGNDEDYDYEMIVFYKVKKQ